MNPIRVMIVDDHDSVRRGLSFSLRAFNNLQCVGAAGNGREAINLCGRIHPDVVLMDVKMPEMDGIAATRIIRQSYPCIQVIALTNDKNSETFQAMSQAGAVGYLLKTASIAEIASAILAANKS
jgi:two-component system, NarL family, response regulator LiaR